MIRAADGVSVLCPYDFIDYCPWRSSFVIDKASYHLLECMPTVHASSRGVGGEMKGVCVCGGGGGDNNNNNNSPKQHLCILGNTTLLAFAFPRVFEIKLIQSF